MSNTKGKRPAGRTMSVTCFFRPYNRVVERMTVLTMMFTAPRKATIERLIELAHEAGASRGDRTLAGVFELQTDEGIWNCPDGSKLLKRTGVALSDNARFRSWDVIESEEG